MKGIQGIIIAAGLGVAGALFNWAYLNSRSENLNLVNFVGIKPEVTLNRGDLIREEAIERVGIPRENVGNLKDFAVLWQSRQTVIGSPVSRSIPGGSLLLEEDTKKPPPQLQLAQEKDEGMIWIPVDTRRFVPSLVTPGALVSFTVPRFGPGQPTPAAPHSPGLDGPPAPEASSADPVSNERIEVIGPFKVLALGNRLGSSEVMKASKKPLVQENVLGISVWLPNGQLNQKAKYLESRLQETNFRQVGVILLPPPDK
jgi:hypothetical protein